MQNSRWWRPLLAFAITFSLMAMGGSLLRAVVVYQHFAALGLQTDDQSVAAEAARELARIDQRYAITFLLVATGVSLAVAAIFAWRRPRPPEVAPPPPLPAERRAETL